MNGVLKLPPAIRIFRPVEGRGCVPSMADAANGLCARPAPTEPATEDTMNSRRFMEGSSSRSMPRRGVDQALHARRAMTMTARVGILVFVAALSVFPNLALAQTPAQPPAPPPTGWMGSASAGLALTQGNSDTSTVNAAYDLKHETTGPIVFKSAGLLVWGKSEGQRTTDRVALSGRVDRKLNPMTAVFGQTQYLRDSFKAIDYLISPTVGISRLLVKNERSEFGVDGSVGVVWEKNPNLELQTDGAVTAGQHFDHKLTATTEFKQKLGALWKMNDFGDALYTFSVGLAASITEGTQMKFEFLDTYKTKPPSADIKKNDIAVLVSFVYKFE